MEKPTLYMALSSAVSTVQAQTLQQIVQKFCLKYP